MRRQHQGLRRTSTSRRITRSSSPLSTHIGASLASTANHRPCGRKPTRQSLSSALSRRGRKRTYFNLSRSIEEANKLPECVTVQQPVSRLSCTVDGSGVHRCKICGNRFDRALQLKSHLLEHGSDRPFPCFVCNVRFTTKWNLIKHQKCRSHRVVQAKSANAVGADKTRPGRHILPKRRKLSRLPTHLVCEIEPSHVHQNEKSGERDTPPQLLRLEVLPFSSPIATQLQTIQLSELGSEIKPFTPIGGTLTLELPDNRTISFPVRLEYEDVANCLAAQNASTNRLNSNDPDRSRVSELKINDITIPKREKVDISGPSLPNESRSRSEDSSESSMITADLATPSSDSSHLDKTINCRTQEEIQAAKTILSLAQSARIPSPSSCPGQGVCQPDSPHYCKTANHMVHLQPRLTNLGEISVSPNMSVKPNHSSNLYVGSADIGASHLAVASLGRQDNQLQTPSVPRLLPNLVSTQGDNITAAASLLHSSRSSDTFPLPKYPIPCAISPKSSKSPRLPIRPPPKKRLSANYRQPVPTMSSGTFDISSTIDLTQKDKPVLCGSVPTPAVITKPVSAGAGLAPTTTVVTVGIELNQAASLPALSRFLSNGSNSGIQTVTNVTRETTEHVLSNSAATFAMVNSLPASSISGNSISATPNLFILPQLMLLPRIISPYIPVSSHPGVMAPCYLVQSDGAARLASPRCAVTVNESSTVLCSSHFTSTSSISFVQSPSPVSSALNGSSASPMKSSSVNNCAHHNQNERPDQISPKNVASDGTQTNASQLVRSSTVSVSVCSSHFVDSSMHHGPNTDAASHPISVLQSLSEREDSIVPHSSTRSSRADLRPKGNTLVTARLVACRNKYRCYECGVVCHKPCLLRKHYRTHSNVRPYVCRHCDVSFKTRGNLSKHMKSKGHHDRCLNELGLDHVPLIVDDQTQIDRQALERQRQLVIKRDHIKRDIWRSKYRAIRANGFLRIRPSTELPTVTGNRVPVVRSAKTRKGKRRFCLNRISDQSKPITTTIDLHTPIPTTLLNTLDSNEKIPAPNVNAVHLLQDLPLNLSVRSRQPPVPIPPHTLESVSVSSPFSTSGSWHGSSVSTTGTTSSYIQNGDQVDPEEVVRTAVAAAKILKNGTTTGELGSDLCGVLGRSNPSLRDAQLILPDQLSHSSAHKTLGSVVTTFISPHHNVVSHRCPAPGSQQFAIKTLNEIRPAPEEQVTALLSAHKPNSTPTVKCTTSRMNSGSRHSATSTTTHLLLPRGDVPETTADTQNGKLGDPRPYKCVTCRVGFRVTGHLHKHFRAKSHLLNELHAHKWAPETIEHVRLSRVNVSQLVNPDNGRLRTKAVERILSASTSIGSSSSSSSASTGSSTTPCALSLPSKERVA